MFARERFQACVKISKPVPGSYCVCFVLQGVEFGNMPVLVVLCFGELRKLPWKYSFLETCYSPEPCVQVETESERASGELLCLCQNAEPMLVSLFRFPKVREVQGAFGLWGVIYSFIFLLSTYYTPGTVLAPVKYW